MKVSVVLNFIAIISAFLQVASCGGQDGAMEQEPASPDQVTQEPVGSNADLDLITAAHIFIPFGVVQLDSVPAQGTGNAWSTVRMVHDRIVSGQSTFEEMAREYSASYTEPGGDRLPSFMPGALAWPLDSAANALEPGEVSGIITTRFGYHIVKRLDI